MGKRNGTKTPVTFEDKSALQNQNGIKSAQTKTKQTSATTGARNTTRSARQPGDFRETPRVEKPSSNSAVNSRIRNKSSRKSQNRNHQKLSKIEKIAQDVTLFITNGKTSISVVVAVLFVVLYNKRELVKTEIFNLLNYNTGNNERHVASEAEQSNLFTSSLGADSRRYVHDHERAVEIRMTNAAKYDFPHSLDGIDRRRDLSLQEFSDVYDGKWPVIIQDLLPTWKASNWTHDFLCDKYGEERVAMKAVNGPSSKTESLSLPLTLFCKHTHMNSGTLWTYVQDEVFLPMRPHLLKDIGPTKYWDEDYFKLLPRDLQPWNAMILWGTKYSRSTLHIDPYNWTGTNAVIFGNKRWKLFPPGQDDLLYVMRGRKSDFPLDCYKYNSVVDTFAVDRSAYPLYEQAQYIEFDQKPGEVLIIPTGWFHQAYNTEETLAISSQFFNENTYKIVIEEILKIGTVPRASLPKLSSTTNPKQWQQQQPQQQQQQPQQHSNNNSLYHHYSLYPEVTEVFSLIPQSVIERGKQVTQDILNQIEL